MNDLRHAARHLLNRPGFTTTSVLTLGLGMGATVALFAVVHSVVLSPLPYDRPAELVALESPVPGLATDAVWGLSDAAYFYFRGESRTLADLGAYTTGELNLSGAGGASRVAGGWVTHSLLSLLRARPALGRLLVEDDDRPGAANVAVLGYDFWRRAFGGDPAVVGSVVELETRPYEVVGVMAEGFDLPDYAVDVWVPRRLDPLRAPVNQHWLSAIGRLEPGVTVAMAQTELARMTERLPELFPGAYDDGFMSRYRFTTRVLPLRDQVLGDAARTLWVLLAAVALVLLIAAINVANLFVIRAETRRGEMALRAALGAGRGALLRQGLAEGALVAAGAGALGLALADAAIRLLLALAPPGLPRLREVAVGWEAVGFTAAAAAAAALAIGLLPLVRTRVEFRLLRDTSARVSGHGRNGVRRTLVMAQVALALVLLAAAGLMLRSLERLRAVPPGLESANTIAFELTLPWAKYRTYQDVVRFHRRLIDEVTALPGVVSAAMGPVPFREYGGCALIFVEDQPVVADERPRCVTVELVSPGYFQTLGIPLQGRAPDWTETETAAAGAVVTQALAQRLWPDQNPIGKGIRGNGWAQPFYRVVGVTGELRANGLDQPPTEAVFFPMVPLEGAPLWSPPIWSTLLVRTSGPGPEQLAGPVRRIVASLDAAAPLGTIATLERVMEDSMARRSFVMLLLAIAGLMALVLSIVGLYGVVAYVVSRRTAEIGIRMALGAHGAAVAADVLRDALVLGAGGAVIGLAVAVAFTRVLRSLLFEVSPTDPTTFAAVTVLLLATAAAASLVPARRAVRVAPMEALRHE